MEERILREPQDERPGERDEAAPLVLREPQDEREEAPSDKRKSRKGIGGPKTAAGKAVVARNAIKHGVLALRLRPSARSGQAPTPVLPLVESAEDWEELRRDVLDWFDLKGAFQESLGERVAGLIWRPGYPTRSRAMTGMVRVVRC